MAVKYYYRTGKRYTETWLNLHLQLSRITLAYNTKLLIPELQQCGAIVGASADKLTFYGFEPDDYGNRWSIEFVDDEHLTAFLLKWS